ncbi:MAG: SWIB/MDM2 domain-containing protein [Patescibacteria group bacterium]
MVKNANSAFMKPKTLSPELEAVVGKGPMPQSEVIKQLWVYIKKNNLQDSKNRRTINADENLKKIFAGESSMDMMKMAKYVFKHIS